MRKSHSVRILFELGPIINAQNARQQYLSLSQHFSKTRGTALVIGAAESCPIVSSKSLSLESVLVLDEASIKLQIWRIRCHCSFSVIFFACRRATHAVHRMNLLFRLTVVGRSLQ